MTMKKLSVVIGMITLMCGTAFTQSRKELIELGDNAFKIGNYGSAVYFFGKILFSQASKDDGTYPYETKSYNLSSKKQKDGDVKKITDEKSLYALHRLAESYRKLKDYDNAENFYRQAYENPTPQFPDTKYYYALTLMSNEKYQDAEKLLEEYIAEAAGTQLKQAQIQLGGCEMALGYEANGAAAVVNELDSNFNNGYSSFGVNYFTDNSVIFASARKGNHIEDPKKESDIHTTDFYIVNIDDEAKSWDAAQHMVGPVNSNQNEGSGVLAVDRTTFYFTRWNPEDRTDCNIYVSRMFNRRWMQPLKIDEINMQGFRTMHPSLNLDESRLYFVSDRPGGLGGLDIWYCTLGENGELGTPVNLGAPVNTEGDETTPYFHSQSGTIFFSSNGHSGFGGLDVFKSHYDEESESWGQPVNLGKPINSSKDDEHYIMDKGQHTGFFSSDRNKCSQCDTTQPVNGNCHRTFTFVKGDIKITISGYVYNSETEEIIPNALITIKDVHGENDPDFITTDENGYYFKEMTIDQEWFMKAQKVKFFADAATVKTVGITESTELTQDFFLRQIPATEIEIPGIEYDFDKATLRPKSKEILDKLYDFLTLNDNLVVEIKSHTDCRGGDAYNMKLSQQRAQSCVDYLISKGIARNRLIPMGRGETEPIPGHECATVEALKDTEPEKFESMHQKNRRTAFKVVSQEGNPVLQGGQ
jgi:outer membrane protein OmpA-like peptidoglycan-associated protein